MRLHVTFLVTVAMTACTGLSSCTHERIRSGSRTRHYILHVPESVAKTAGPAPLILVFHGLGGSAAGMRHHTALDAEANRLGFVVAYLEGAGLYAGWDSDGVADLRFVKDIIEELSRNARIDSKRVFAVGFSSGGQFVQRLACDPTVSITAFASISATTDSATANKCPSGRGVSALVMVGTEDRTVGWDDVETQRPIPSLTVERSVGHWANLNECSIVPTVSQLRIEPESASGVERWNYVGCRAGRKVVLYILRAHGHGWPNTIGIRSGNDTVSASRLITEFFESTVTDTGR